MADEFNPEVVEEPLILEQEPGIGPDLSQEIEVKAPNEEGSYSPPMLDLISTLGALAQNDTSDPAMNLSLFQESVDAIKGIIDGGGEIDLRANIALQESAAETKFITDFLVDQASTQGADLAEIEALAASVPAAMEEFNNMNKLEQVALDRIEDFAIRHPEQSDLLELFMKGEEGGGTGILGSLREQLERTIIIRREADKAAQTVADQSLGADIFDLLARVIPFNKLTSVDNIVESSMFDLSGTKLLMARRHLMNIPRAEFDKILPEIIQRIKDESGFISENAQLIRENLHQLGQINEQEATLENLFDFIDFATVAPTLKVIPNLGKATVAKFSRNRDLGQTVTEHTMRTEQNMSVVTELEGTARTGAIAEEAAEEAIENSMPSAMKATDQLVDGTVGLEVNRSLAANQMAIAEVKTILEQTPRLTQQELGEALEAATIEAQKKFGEGAVIDFRVISEEVAEGIKVDKFSMILGKKDGIGYSDRASAIIAAKRKGIPLVDESYAPVKAANKKLDAAKKKETKVRDTVQANIEKIEQKGKRGDSKVDAAINKELDKIERAKAATAKADKTFENELNKQIAAKTKNAELIKQGKIVEGRFIQDADGLHYINVKSNPNEAGYVHILEEEGRTSGFIYNNFIRSPSSFLPDVLQRRAASAVFTKGRIEKIMRPLIKNLQGLSRKERDRIGAVAKAGNIEKKWYNSSEFTTKYSEMHNGRLPTRKDILSYYTLKDINDFEYILQNHSIYTTLSSQGFITARVEASNGVKISTRNMKPIERIDDVNRALMLDVTEDVLIEGRKIGLDTLEARMKNEGLKLYRLDSNVTHKGQKVNHILVKEGDISVKDLEYRQLDYIGGGHRLYKGKFLAKQAVTGATESGAKYVDNPLTHIIGPTRGTVDEWVNRMNEARLAFMKQKADSSFVLQADRIIRDAGIEDGVEGWAKLLDDGEINNNPFQTLFDQELPKAHLEIKNADGTYDLTFSKTGQHAYLEQQGIPYFMKRKGNILKGPQDETAELIDPFTAATRAVENAASVAAFSNYRINAVQRWLKTYGTLLPASDGLSPLQRFWSDFDVKKLKGQDQNVINRAESTRRAIRRQLGTEGTFGKTVRHSLRNLADWVEGGASTGARTGVAKFVLNQMDKDPVSAIKGFSFDLKLGLFDPSQLIIQTQTIAALVSLNPTRAHRYIFDGALMRYAAVNTSDEMLNWAAKRSAMNSDEFKAMTRSMRESGITDINGELVMLDHHATASLHTVGSVKNKIRDLGRIPFFEAERLNRIYAWRKSWDDMRTGKARPTDRERQGFGGGKPISVESMLTKEGRAELARRTDKFTMNMTSASAAFWQKGVLSIPTQFLSYQARILENILPAIAGGNKQWTRSEKFRLFVGQVLLYGGAGIPGGRYVLDKIFSATGTEFDPENKADQVAYRALVGGFWDSMLYAVTNGELDVAFSQRAAVGTAVEDFIEKISGGGFETQSLLQVIGGAPFSVLGDVSSDAWDVLRTVVRTAASVQVSVTDLNPMLITKLTDNASSLSRMHRAYYVWKYGEWVSQETGKVLSKATKTETIAAALGFQLRDLADANFANSLIRRRKEFIKEHAKLINKLQLESVRLWNSGDREGWELKQREITMWSQVLDSRDREALAAATIGTTDWRNYVERTTDAFNSSLKPTGSPDLPAANTPR